MTYMRDLVGGSCRVWLAAFALAGSLSACGSADPSGPVGAEEATSSIEFDLQTVPASTQCIRITATSGAGTVTTKIFAVTSGASSSSLQFTKVLPGNYTLAGDAFNVACASIGSSVGDWIADPVVVTLRAGAASTTTLTFRKNSAPVVNANFVNNVLAVTASYDSTFVLTDAGFLQAGGISGTKTFVRTNFAAFDPGLYGPVPATAIATTNSGICAVRSDGTVWCWGSNLYGELGPNIGLGATSTVPVQVPGITDASLIASGYFHTCALARYNGAQNVYCWGYNGNGQLGNNTTTSSTTPVPVYGLVTAKSLAAGGHSSYALDAVGQSYAWGYNGFGQFGDGSTSSPLIPIIASNKGYTAYQSAGSYHTCNVGFDGSVRCYGYNGMGQLGNGTTVSSAGGVSVIGLTAKQVVSNGYSNCAISTAGQTLCWGNNWEGEVGDLTNTNRSVPTPQAPGTPAFVSLGMGLYTGCGLTAGSDVYCWGSNGVGQLGDGTTNSPYQPVKAILQ